MPRIYPFSISPPLHGQKKLHGKKIIIDIYGTGPDEANLKKLAAKYGEDIIKFHPPVPIAKVRELMREHDVYVMASNGYEGWGAVVSEALEEGMKVIGTYEAGSCATMLPEKCLYRAGAWRRLMAILVSDLPKVDVGEWTARKASETLLASIFSRAEAEEGFRPS